MLCKDIVHVRFINVRRNLQLKMDSGNSQTPSYSSPVACQLLPIEETIRYTHDAVCLLNRLGDVSLPLRFIILPGIIAPVVVSSNDPVDDSVDTMRSTVY